MTQTSFIQSTRAETRRHGVEARSEVIDAGAQNLLQIGTIVEATDGSYTVAIGLDPDATIEDPEDPEQSIPAPPLAIYTRVFCVPAASLTVGDDVWLVFQPGAQPVIQASGGGSPCYRSPLDWGALF